MPRARSPKGAPRTKRGRSAEGVGGVNRCLNRVCNKSAPQALGLWAISLVMKETSPKPEPAPAEALRQSLRALEAFAGPTVLLDAQARVLALGAEARTLTEERLS